MDMLEAGTAGAPQVLLLETEENPVALPAPLLESYHFLIPQLSKVSSTARTHGLPLFLQQTHTPFYALCATADCCALGMQSAAYVKDGLVVLEYGEAAPGSVLVPDLELHIPSGHTQGGQPH